MSASRPRIGVVAPALPPIVGGAEAVAESLIRVLIGLGFLVDVVSGTEYASIRDEITANDGRFVFVGRDVDGDVVPWEFDCFARSEALWRLNEEAQIDLWHVFSHDCAVAVAMCSPSVPVVGTFSEMSTEADGAGRARSRFTYSLKCLTAVTASSDFYESVALRHGFPASGVQRLMTGIDVHGLRHGDSERGRSLLGVSGNAPVVLCPSRFSPRKGQLDLVEAVSRISNVRLDVILLGSSNSGSTTYLQSVRRRIEAKGLSQTIRVVDGVDRGDMPNVLAAADLIVQPSYGEGLGLSALEAMAAGVPLAATAVSGFDGFLRHEGNSLTSRPGDVEGLATNMLRLLRDEALSAQLTARGIVDAQEFGLERTAIEVMKLYGDLVPAWQGGLL